MKNHRFLWLRNRTTNNRKCEKARNIKEKRTIEMFSTVSKQLDVHHSSQNVNHTLRNIQRIIKPLVRAICQEVFSFFMMIFMIIIITSNPLIFSHLSSMINNS